MWLKIFGAVVVLVGVIFVFEGENIIKKYFADMEDNKNATIGIKALGTILSLVGGLLIIYNI